MSGGTAILLLIGVFIGTVVWGVKWAGRNTKEQLNGVPGISLQPDMKFATQGYMQVAIVRRNSPGTDLHHLEWANAQALLNSGCTVDQALSARWGGAYAATDPLANFDDAILAYKETCKETGRSFEGRYEDVELMYKAAACLVVATMHASNPEEYRNFLRFIGQVG